MKPKDTQRNQADLFRARLDQILNREHPLFVLAKQINWSVFDKKFGSLYAEKGRPAKPTRLIVGLHYLKHAFDESDESVVARLLENGYWQYFCGFEYFIHEPPVDPTSMMRWRKQIGPKNMEALLSKTLETAKRGSCNFRAVAANQTSRSPAAMPAPISQRLNMDGARIGLP